MHACLRARNTTRYYDYINIIFEVLMFFVFCFLFCFGSCKRKTDVHTFAGEIRCYKNDHYLYYFGEPAVWPSGKALGW